MKQDLQNCNARGRIIFLLVLLNVIVIKAGFIYGKEVYTLLLALLPLLLLAINDGYGRRRRNKSTGPGTRWQTMYSRSKKSLKY